MNEQHICIYYFTLNIRLPRDTHFNSAKKTAEITHATRMHTLAAHQTLPCASGWKNGIHNKAHLQYRRKQLAVRRLRVRWRQSTASIRSEKLSTKNAAVQNARPPRRRTHKKKKERRGDCVESRICSLQHVCFILSITCWTWFTVSMTWFFTTAEL